MVAELRSDLQKVRVQKARGKSLRTQTPTNTWPVMRRDSASSESGATSTRCWQGLKLGGPRYGKPQPTAGSGTSGAAGLQFVKLQQDAAECGKLTSSWMLGTELAKCTLSLRFSLHLSTQARATRCANPLTIDRDTPNWQRSLPAQKISSVAYICMRVLDHCRRL